VVSFLDVNSRFLFKNIILSVRENSSSFNLHIILVLFGVLLKENIFSDDKTKNYLSEVFGDMKFYC